MAHTKNALIRYKTIDKCLQNPYRKWTLNDLIEACSDALYEYEGRDINVSKRTVQMDIQLMRSDKLGYNAPIEVYDKKFYRYEDPDYSITDIPITESDMSVLSETVEMLKQFKDFSLFSELGGIIQRLEDKVYAEKTQQAPVILLDKNEQLKGLEHLDILYQAILKKMVLKIGYQSFRARQQSNLRFHPFVLKEFNNRWFLIGKHGKNKPIVNLALDRIISIDYDLDAEHLEEEFDGEKYYKNTVGVTVMGEDQVQEIVLHLDQHNAPYVLTKPLHHSQELIEQKKDRSAIIKLKVHVNFELERLILGFGDGIKVIAPERLKRIMKSKFSAALDLYETELSSKLLKEATVKLQRKGYCILNKVYTKKEVRKIKKELESGLSEKHLKPHGVRLLFREMPQLKPLVLTENLKSIIQSIAPEAFLIKATYFDKPEDANWQVNWHQDKTINLLSKKETDGFQLWTKKEEVISVCPPEELMKETFAIRVQLDTATDQNGALKVIPGTHQKYLTDEEIQLITENSAPTICSVEEGGVQLMKPLLLHASEKTKNQRRRRVIHLEFACWELPEKLDLLEKENI